jgi:uncharacterized protein DUF2490
MTVRTWAIALVIISCSTSFSPAAAQVITDGRLWANLSVQERPGTASPWRWSGEFVLRTRDGVDELDVLVARGLVGYDLTARSNASLGFGIIPSFPPIGDTLLEKRLFEQYLWSGRGLGGSLAMRTRLEQRWAETNDGLAWRVRQQVRYVRPFAPGSHYALVASEELIAHLNQTRRYDRGFDQNRAFGGIARTVSAKVRIEAGYLNQFLHALAGPDRVNHILSVTTALAF